MVSRVLEAQRALLAAALLARADADVGAVGFASAAERARALPEDGTPIGIVGALALRSARAGAGAHALAPGLLPRERAALGEDAVPVLAEEEDVVQERRGDAMRARPSLASRPRTR